MENMTKCGSMKAYWTHPDSDAEQFASNAAFVISAITFFTNLVINAFILSCPELRKTRVNIFMVAIGTSDMIYSVFFTSTQTWLHQVIDDSPQACWVWNLCDGYFFCLSWFTFVGLNLDRLYAIKRPIGYQSAIQRHGAGKVVLFSWVVNLIPGIPLLFDETISEAFLHGCDGCYKPMLNPSWVWSQVTMAFVIPSIIMVIIWANMAHIMATQTRDRLYVEITIKVVAITAFFMICISPFCVVFMVAGVSELNSSGSFFATYSLALVNSCIQPFIFVYLNTQLKSAIASWISKCKT